MAITVSFYSYKGGVGRSVLLANVAAILAQKGRKVVCIDFDLEAGGLHTIFNVEKKDIRLTVLDILCAPGMTDVGHGLIDLTKLLKNPASEGKLWLLPTISEINQLNIALESRRDLPMVLGQIITNIESYCMPDIIFVDSRAGFAEIASAPLRKADKLVCVLRPNHQNVDGLRILLDILDALRLKPDTYLVLSQVPEIPKAKTVIEKLQSMLGKERRFDCIIPYVPELALEEVVAALVSMDSSVVDAYKPVCSWLEKELYER